MVLCRVNAGGRFIGGEAGAVYMFCESLDVSLPFFRVLDLLCVEGYYFGIFGYERLTLCVFERRLERLVFKSTC